MNPQGLSKLQKKVFPAKLDILGFAFLLCLFSYNSFATPGLPVRLNAPMVQGGNVTAYSISLTNNRVVYLADQDVNEQFELYSVHISGTNSVKLNHSLRYDEDITDFEISSDGTKVVYSVDEELYYVPITGGTPIRLNVPCESNNIRVGSHHFLVSPDSSKIATYGDGKIFCIPITGGTAIQLSLNSHTITYWRSFFTFTPDSEQVIYAANNNFFTVPAVGGTPSELIWGDIPSTETISSSMISPNGSYLIFRTVWIEGGDVYKELYSIPSTGGIPVSLSNGKVLELNSETSLLNFIISPNSSRIVYRSKNTPFSITSATRYEIYSVPITGGNPIKLNGNLLGSTTACSRIDTVSIRIINGLVIYLACQDTPDIQELYSVPLTGGTSTKLNHSLTPGKFIARFITSPDGSRINFVVANVANYLSDDTELYSALTISGAKTQLTVLQDTWNSIISDLNITPDNKQHIYMANQEQVDIYNIYKISNKLGQPIRLNNSFLDQGVIVEDVPTNTQYKLTKDGLYLTYRSKQYSTNQTDLFSVKLDTVISDTTSSITTILLLKEN